MEDRTFVGSISVESTQQALRDAFSVHDQVVAVFVTADRATGQARRVRLATRGSGEQAEYAISAIGADGDDEAGRSGETYEWRDSRRAPAPHAAGHRGKQHR